MAVRTTRIVIFALCLLCASALSAGAKSICAAGDSLQVEWHGTWYPAHALEEKGGLCRIHYNGYDSSWDEWVGPERLKNLGKHPGNVNGPWKGNDFYHRGDNVLVLWRYLWYPATVRKVRHGRLYIHYDGWAKSWDEWVGPKRVKISDPEERTKPAS